MDQAFIDACNFIMPAGEFRGQRIAQIGMSDEGLKRLDWLYRQPWLADPLKSVLRTYLPKASLGSQVEAMIEY